MVKRELPNGEQVAKRMCYLAWVACGGPLGMGIFQNNPNVTEEDVWNNMKTKGDYPGKIDPPKAGECYGDYVFGRMMKLGFKYDGYVGHGFGLSS